MGQSKKRRELREARAAKHREWVSDAVREQIGGKVPPCRYTDKRGTCVLDQHTGGHIFHICNSILTFVGDDGWRHGGGICDLPAAFRVRIGTDEEWRCGKHLPGLRVRNN